VNLHVLKKALNLSTLLMSYKNWDKVESICRTLVEQQEFTRMKYTRLNVVCKSVNDGMETVGETYRVWIYIYSVGYWRIFQKEWEL
jgi:hypothetical protein